MQGSLIPVGRISRVAMFAALALGATNVSAKNQKPSGALEFLDVAHTQAILRLDGNAQEVGRFTCYGELDFVPGAEEGTMDGTGVLVLMARNGDLLVGNVTAQLDETESLADFRFSWRDSVTLHNGTIVSNTGRFVKHRPPGLVVITRVPEPQTDPLDTLILIIVIILRT
jgi:hypothetical protein